MVNLEWYRTFKAVYQNGTLTRAAEELLLSQPAVSVQLAALEAHIGQPLFIRRPRKMEPTAYGQALYTKIVEPLYHLEKVEAEFKRSVLDRIPTLRLGAPIELFQNDMAAQTGHLDYVLELRFGLASALQEAVRKNDLDMALVTKRDAQSGGLCYEPVVKESFMVICGRNFDSREFDTLVEPFRAAEAEKWLTDQTWYAYDYSLSTIRRFWQGSFAKRPLLTLQAVIPDHNALIEAVAHNKALTVSSDLLARKALARGDIRVLWGGSVRTENTLYIAYDRKRTTKEMTVAVKAYLESCFGA